MILTRGTDNQIPHADRAVVVGAFDGLHIGHQYLIRRTCAEAFTRGLESTVFTFEPVPYEVSASPGGSGQRLTVEDERMDMLRHMCVDRVVVQEFSETFRSKSAEEFARDILVGKLNTKILVASENHTIGCCGEADINAITALGNKYGFAVVVLPLLTLGDMRVSSTQIRKYLREAHADEAASLLGRPYNLRGKVVTGVGMGRKLGYPTANIEVPPNKLVPAPAVYAGQADGPALRRQLPNTSLPCPVAINIGPQPTFGRQRSAIEAYIITDKPLELVGETLDISFLRRIRFAEKFDDADALATQIARDVDQVRRIAGAQNSITPSSTTAHD